MSRGPRNCAVVLAGGEGKRAGSRKQFERVAGRSLLYHACVPFLRCREVGGLVVVVPRGFSVAVTEEMFDRGAEKLLAVVMGGRTRHESSRAGLAALPDSCELVLLHDAARPFASSALVRRVLRAARAHGAAIPVIPVADSVVELGAEGGVKGYLRRHELGSVQTPQGFQRELLETAFAKKHSTELSDDASAVLAAGGSVVTVPGEAGNGKITSAEDLEAACRRLQLEYRGGGGMSWRVGEGIDRHRLEAGRPLILGGVKLEHPSGLVGHSDGDALTHAVCDALLGAMALGDLGQLFSDSDPANAGRDSMDFLAEVARRLEQAGARVENLDATIMAEEPRMAPHVPAMRARLAQVLGVEPERISVKATRGEGLGPEGEGKAITVRAVAMVEHGP